VPVFAAAGAKAIVLVARNEIKLQEVSESIKKQYPQVETLPVSTDIADPSSVAALFEKVKEKYGHADVLINNAGIFKAIAPIKDVDQQGWWDELVSEALAHSSLNKVHDHPYRLSIFAVPSSSLRTSSSFFPLLKLPPKSSRSPAVLPSKSVCNSGIRVTTRDTANHVPLQSPPYLLMASPSLVLCNS
jgi:NAD(P)-dependent dehydrogenase (short-subunit alcohol dehydrogenase family)